MGSDPIIVVYDACVLYPFHLRNLLIQVAVEDLVVARWTDEIHDEWIRSLAGTGVVSRERLLATRDLMKSVLPEADVQGYARHVAGLTLPDQNDRHVLAAAIEGGASVILTWNLRHFPTAETTKYNVAVRDPDSFLTALCDEEPDAVAAVIAGARTNLTRSEPTMEEYLLALEKQGLRSFVARTRTIVKAHD